MKNKYDYNVQGLYWNGWETVYTATTKAEAQQILADYQRNEEYPFRIKKVVA